MRNFLIVMAVGMALAGAAQAQQDDVTGLWLTENGKAVVELARCDAGLCGEIYWLREDARQYDYQNPDEALRATPLCGMRILWGFEQTGPAAWQNGTIYKADDGDTYHAQLELTDNGDLHLRGYVGIPLFGKSQTWTRVNTDSYKQCDGPTRPFDAAKTGAEPAAERRELNE